jgi:hypothetical protein
LQIIVLYIDLQTWGRLRSSCRGFRKTLPLMGPPPLVTLHALFSPLPIDSDMYMGWRLDVKNVRHICYQFFVPCVKRFLLFSHNLMEQTIQEFNSNPPAPRIVTRLDGIVIEIPPDAPTNFDLVEVLHQLARFPITFNKVVTRKWFKLPFSKEQVYFPYGYICGPDGAAPHGNIFIDDWRQLVYVNSYRKLEIKNFPTMSPEQRDVFKQQKTQLGRLKALKYD